MTQLKRTRDSYAQRDDDVKTHREKLTVYKPRGLEYSLSSSLRKNQAYQYPDLGLPGSRSVGNRLLSHLIYNTLLGQPSQSKTIIT